MHAWLAFLTRNRLLELALAVALGSAAVTLAASASDTAVSVLAQHVGTDPSGEDGIALDLLSLSPYYLYFTVGDTFIVYGTLVSTLLTLALLSLLALVVVRRRNRVLAACPLCASRIPHESTHCAYCGSAIAPVTT